MRKQAIHVAWIGCAAFAAFAALALAAGFARAQGQVPPGGMALDETGVLEGADQGGVAIKTGTGNIWKIMINRDTTVHVLGTATADFLHPGLAVRTNGEVDKKGALKEELKELEIYSPSKSDYGVFASEADDKPLKALEDGGKYYIKGRIKNYKAGMISISAGTKTITGKVASDASIKVNASDPTFGQPEDEVKVTGWYFIKQGPGPNKPGIATGKDVTVTLAKPLTGGKKKPEKPGKTTKPAKGGGFPGKALPPVQDPFGPAAK